MGIFKNSQGKLLYDCPGTSIMLASFMGATTEIDDDGRIIDYIPRGEIVINVAQICAFYDHTIMVCGHKIRVMETLEEIRRKLLKG